MNVPVARQRIQRLLHILARATLGDYSLRTDGLADHPDDEFLEVEAAINILLEELQLARQQSLDQQHEIEEAAHQIHSKQEELLRALSTPIIVVARGVLAMPIIGVVEAARAQTMTECMLERVARERATHIILDLTGAGAIGKGTAQTLFRMAQAVRLLGSRCILTGLSPEMARTLVEIDFDSTNILTLPNLAEAIDHVLGQGQSPNQNKNKSSARGPA